MNVHIPQLAKTAPLSRYTVFSTQDVDEARCEGTNVFCEHRLRVLDARARIDAYMCLRRFKGVGVGRMSYGGNVSIEPGSLDTFLLVQMPLSGHEMIRSGDIVVHSNRDTASVIGHQRPFSMSHHAGTEKLFVRVDREVLDRHCQQHLGHSMRKPIDFRMDMPLDTVAGQRWMRMVNWLVCEADAAGAEGQTTMGAPLIEAQIEQLVLTMLLTCQPHSYTEALCAEAPAIAPSFVKRVERFIDEHAHEAITVVDLAEHAGVSCRSLFAGFRRFRDTSPMQYLKDVRLQRVHDELLASDPFSVRVTTVALNWGFSHLGHFSADYKRRFGESPSDTLVRG